jgi:flagellar secretion chaperone FliS
MRSWKKYAANEVQTSNPIKVTIMAYERCLLNMKYVKTSLENSNNEQVDEKIINTEKIINELNLQLNRDKGASKEMIELVYNLENLYVWILEELEKIRNTKEATNIDGIIVVIQDLLDGYRGAEKNNE